MVKQAETTNKAQRHILPTYALEDVILMLDDEELMERDFGIDYTDRRLLRKDAYSLLLELHKLDGMNQLMVHRPKREKENE